MAKPCTICHHPERKAIEQALLEDETGHRLVARRFGISAAALHRHSKNHLPELMARALAAKPGPTPEDSTSEEQALEIARPLQTVEAEKEDPALDALQQLKAVNAACLEVLRQARTDGQPSILLRAVDRIVRQIELQDKLLGQIQGEPTVNITVLPEWQGLRLRVLEALRPYPEARLAVVRVLKGGPV